MLILINKTLTKANNHKNQVGIFNILMMKKKISEKIRRSSLKA
jgi:hypothetical protein